MYIIKELFHRFSAMFKLLMSKDYLLVTQHRKNLVIRNTFPPEIVAKSGKAIYINA